METGQYIHECPDWPRFKWRHRAVLERLSEVRHRQGRLIGRMESLGFDLRREATMRALTQEVVTSSEIEGERLDERQVRSSIARRLGLEVKGVGPPDRNVDGIVEMMLDATSNYSRDLTIERILGWQAALFPTRWSGMRRIVVGSWRDDAGGPMQVVSGPVGLERVRFEAPEAARLDSEMSAFVRWFNAPRETDDVLRGAIAHLWFVTVHPFEDGNGRIARALSDMLLARSEQTSSRFYSMSAQIRRDRSDYYAVLERTQRGTLDVTGWVRWFLACLGRSIEGAEATLQAVLDKGRFWIRMRDAHLNARQRKMLNRLLDGFVGKLTSSKWAKICKCSHDSALRDINQLCRMGVLTHSAAGGRSTSYDVVQTREG